MRKRHDRDDEDEENDDDDDDDDDYDRIVKKKSIVKKRSTKKSCQKAHKVPAFPTVERVFNRATGNNYQKNVDEWRRNVRYEFSKIPIDELKDSTIMHILSGFDVVKTGIRSVMEWRLKRVFNGKHNIKSSSSVLGSCFRKPTFAVLLNPNPQSKFFIDGKDVMQYNILPRFDVEDLFSIMYSCRFLYSKVHPILCKIAFETFGTFGTPIVWSYNRYVKWIHVYCPVSVSHLKERLGVGANNKVSLAFGDIDIRNIGYLDYIANNEKLLFKQSQAKRLDAEFSERVKSEKLDAFNNLLEESGFPCFCVKRVGDKYTLKSDAVEYLVSTEPDLKIIVNEAKNFVGDKGGNIIEIIQDLKSKHCMFILMDDLSRFSNDMFKNASKLREAEVKSYFYGIKNVSARFSELYESNSPSHVLTQLYHMSHKSWHGEKTICVFGIKQVEFVTLLTGSCSDDDSAKKCILCTVGHKFKYCYGIKEFKLDYMIGYAIIDQKIDGSNLVSEEK